MSFTSFVKRATHGIKSTMKYISDDLDAGSKIGTAVGKVTKKGLKKGFDAATGAGVVGTATLKNMKEFAVLHGDDMKNIGKGLIKEGSAMVHAGAGAVELLDRSGLMKSVGLGESLIKRRLTKPGVALLMAGSFVASSGKAGKEYIEQRQGSNDGQLYRPTPMSGTPYQLSQQMAFSSQGRSFADNAGADDDLVKALHNMR